MGICTNEITNLTKTVHINTKDILILENGVIKTTTGKVVEIAVGSQSGGLEIEPIIADNLIEIPGADLIAGSTYTVTQETADSDWSNFRIFVELKNNVASPSLSIHMKLYNKTNDLIYDKTILPAEYITLQKTILFNQITIPYPGFRKISLTFDNDNSATELTNVQKLSIDMFKFDRPQTIENLIIKSYPLDPIVSVPGQAWYNTTENVWKMTFLNESGNIIIKTYAYADGISADDLIWMTVL